MLLFLGQLLSLNVIKLYDEKLAQLTVLMFFMPLIISSGGNSGSQAATLVIRAMALEEVVVTGSRIRRSGVGSALVTTLLGPTADDGASTRDLVQGPAPTAGPVVVLGSEPVSDPTLGAPTFGEPVFGENEVGLQRVGFEGEALVDDSRAIQVFVPTTPSSSGAGQLAGYQSGARGQGGLRLR